MVSRCFPGGYNVKLYISRGMVSMVVTGFFAQWYIWANLRYWILVLTYEYNLTMDMPVTMELQYWLQHFLWNSFQVRWVSMKSIQKPFTPSHVCKDMPDFYGCPRISHNAVQTAKTFWLEFYHLYSNLRVRSIIWALLNYFPYSKFQGICNCLELTFMFKIDFIT